MLRLPTRQQPSTASDVAPPSSGAIQAATKACQVEIHLKEDDVLFSANLGDWDLLSQRSDRLRARLSTDH